MITQVSFASDAAGPRHRRHPTGNHTADSEDIPDGAAAVARLVSPLLVFLLLLLYLGRRSGGLRVSPRGGRASPEPGMKDTATARLAPSL